MENLQIIRQIFFPFTAFSPCLNINTICEGEECNPLNAEDVVNEFSHTDMLQFCKFLYNDISENMEDWISFDEYEETELKERKADIIQKLGRLKDLISKREKFFYRIRY